MFVFIFYPLICVSAFKNENVCGHYFMFCVGQLKIGHHFVLRPVSTWMSATKNALHGTSTIALKSYDGVWF